MRYEFTKDVPIIDLNDEFDKLENWNEEEAKQLKKVSCHDCRYFSCGCDRYVGMYHKPCNEFEWW